MVTKGRSSALNLDGYDTDKVRNNFFVHYDRVLEPWVDREMALLELGIYHGGSVRLWRDYFPKGMIVGIDADPPADLNGLERIRVFRGLQEDTDLLSRVAAEAAPGGFDIIIDDASHLAALTKTAFWHLFDNHLKPGGVYAIEDWTTGFFEDWPDGKRFEVPREPAGLRKLLKSIGLTRRENPQKVPFYSHPYGMVGFIKQLIDEQAATARSQGRHLAPTTTRTKFARILVTTPIVFVTKIG